ncbi:hypothetical protein OXX80_013781, partial [Metschnikowia pulcherrima]
AIQENQAFNAETGYLLGKKDTQRFGNKKCLVLDLDETLVHSSFKYLRTADFVIPVEIEDQVHHVYVIKRPGVDEFLRQVGKWYEVVVFTASVAKYGDPLLNKLDIHRAVHQRLFRDSCYTYQGNFIQKLAAARAAPTRPDHHRQLARVVYIPPATLGADLELVQRHA